jgi:hypothetical protein
MKRDVQCFVTNNTDQSFYVQSKDLSHGETDTEPQTIKANQPSTLIFHFHKTTDSTYGVTGSVTYELYDKSILYFSFNCPYTQQGTEGEGNCFFYAGLQNVPTITTYTIACTVTIDGNPMNASNPPKGGTMVANIVIND